MVSLLASYGTKVSAELIKKVAAGLLAKYHANDEDKNTLGDLMPTESELVDGITRLLNENSLSFNGKTKLEDYEPALVGKVTNAVADFQTASSGLLKITRLFGKDTIKRLLTRKSCGAIVGRKLEPGRPIEILNNGKHVMRFFIEGLPNVGNARQSYNAFLNGIESWQNELNLEISEETADSSNANLIVSYKVLKNVDAAVLALTDVGSGPETGGVLRMMFDAAEPSWSAEQLEATTAHELGHALGIRHADVPEPNQLMNDTLDLQIGKPQEFDIRAAVTKGWGRR